MSSVGVRTPQTEEKAGRREVNVLSIFSRPTKKVIVVRVELMREKVEELKSEKQQRAQTMQRLVRYSKDFGLYSE